MLNIFINKKWIITLGIALMASSTLYFPVDAQAQTGIVTRTPGAIWVSSVTVNSSTRTAIISGGGEGGIEKRYHTICADGTDAYGFYVTQLFSNPQPPISVPASVHPIYPYNRVTDYWIDGSASPHVNYVLNRTSDGVSIGPSDSCDGLSFAAAEYSFSFPIDISGLSIGWHTVEVSAFDEASRAQIYSGPFSFEVSGIVGGPITITKESRSALAIIKKPSVNLLVNGRTNDTVPLGSRPTLTWATDSVDEGNACTASNSNNAGVPVDPLWDGFKNGYGGGSQAVGPMTREGVYTYSIVCRGYGGSVTVPPSNVQIVVGSAPAFNCVLMSLGFTTITQGSSTTATLKVEPLNGFSENVKFTGQVIPPGPNAPVIVEPYTNNPQIDPYIDWTSALIDTSASTTPGEYQIIFTGTSESSDTVTCPPVIVAVDQITPLARIHCGGQSNQNSCTVPYNGSSKISWESSLVTNCTVRKNGVVWDNQLSQVYPPGKDSGPLTVNTTFDLACTGSYGPVNSSVLVNVTPVPPQQPNNVQATTSSGCGTARVTWDGPLVPPAPENYQVYRSTSTVLSTFQPIGGLIPEDGSPTYSYLDGGPFVPDTRYYYAVAAIIGSQYSTLVPSNGVIPVPCAPSLNLSNKDLVRVNNNTQIPPNSCNNLSDVFVLPNRDIFKTGSKVYFNINVCNSGTEDMKSIVVTETDAHNLDEVRLESKLGGCVLSGSGTGPYRLRDLPAPQPGQYTVCTVQISGILRAVSDPPVGFLHRFWNRAMITANNLPDKPVTTPPYLFSDTGTPVRNETAP